MTVSETPLLDALKRDGYVVVPNILDKHMLLGLKGACKYTMDGARQGKWPSVRTVPKQYPPWQPFKVGDNIWGVQHLLHPNMVARDTFAECYFGDPVLDVVKELVDVKSDDSLVMELFNLLVSPAGNEDFELCWHRDDIRPDVTPEEEERQLKEKSPEARQLHAQYNIALYDDASLIVIPGSHKRVRTQTERDAGLHDSLPDQLIVELKPGDAVFYDSNILHRGAYKGIDTQKELGRMTLHGSVGLAGYGNERARQVLQHNIGEWVGRAKFDNPESTITERAENMRHRLMAMGKGDGLGYSLEG